MAKKAICEQCGKAEALQVFGSVPDGWLTVVRQGEPSVSREREFCSVVCVWAWAEGVKAPKVERPAGGQRRRQRCEACGHESDYALSRGDVLRMTFLSPCVNCGQANARHDDVTP